MKNETPDYRFVGKEILFAEGFTQVLKTTQLLYIEDQHINPIFFHSGTIRLLMYPG